MAPAFTYDLLLLGKQRSSRGKLVDHWHMEVDVCYVLLYCNHHIASLISTCALAINFGGKFVLILISHFTLC